MRPVSILSSLGYSTAICLLFISCGSYLISENRQKENRYYVKTTPNVPLLTEKNDFSISGMRSAGAKLSGVEIQTAYMPAKHIGITGSCSFMSNPDYMKYGQFELGSGYVTKFSKGWHFETYAGFGNGKIKNTHETGSSKLNLTHYFIQPAIAISNAKKTVQFAFVSRFEGVNIKVIDTSFDNAREPLNTSQVQSLYKEPFHIMWQPGFIFRFGWKKFLFHAGYSWSSDLTNSEIIGRQDNFSFGALFRFNAGRKTGMKPQGL